MNKMTDRKDALTELLDKVKAGKWHNDGTTWLFGNDWPNVHGAFYGSLDAARALHDAVLPGWGWSVSDCMAKVSCDYRIQSGHDDHNPARAWLIAILNALIADENINVKEE